MPSRTTARGAGEIAAAAGVQRLVLVHVAEEADDPAYMAAMLAEAREVFDGCVIGGADGLLLEI